MSSLEADVRINSQSPVKGELAVERDIEFVTSISATKPDPSWEYTDQQGHFHAYGVRDDAQLPTLDTRTEHIECASEHDTSFAYDEADEEPCEGYDVTYYVCRLCEDRIEPGRLPDSDPVAIPGRWSWSVVARMLAQPREQVSVRVRTGAGEFFGFAQVTSVAMDAGGSPTANLIGIGPLGQRKVPPKCACPLIDVSTPGHPSFARGDAQGRCPVHRDPSMDGAVEQARRVARGDVPDPFYEG